MRSQEKAIIDAVQGGAFNLSAAFLATGELMELAAKVSAVLGGDPKQMSRNTVQAWLAKGVVAESTRSERNRLFSTVDLVQLAVVFHCTHTGLSLEAAQTIAEQIIARWKAEPERFMGKIDPAEFDSRHYILLATDGGRWRITEPQSEREIRLNLLSSGLVVILNQNLLVGFSIAIAAELFKEKASRLLTKVQAEIKQRKVKK